MSCERRMSITSIKVRFVDRVFKLVENGLLLKLLSLSPITCPPNSNFKSSTEHFQGRLFLSGNVVLLPFAPAFLFKHGFPCTLYVTISSLPSRRKEAMYLDRSRCHLHGNSSLRWLFDLDIFLHCPAFLLDNRVCDLSKSFLSGKICDALQGV